MCKMAGVEAEDAPQLDKNKHKHTRELNLLT
jgi:hypothetical protein